MKLIVLCLFLFFSSFEAKLCPDGAYSCPDWGTCCINSDSSYGCCPYKNADCCSDFIHCCPEGSHCNVTNRSCDSGKASSTSFLWMVPHYHPKSVTAAFEEVPYTKLEVPQIKASSAEGNVCPDGKLCRDTETCCPIGGGRFGCCPYRNGVCCEDKVHCCPERYNCDLVHRKCNRQSSLNSTEIPENFPIFNIDINEFELPVNKDLCDACLLLGKVCCSNGKTVNCCPKGTTCSSDNDKGCSVDISEKTGYFNYPMDKSENTGYFNYLINFKALTMKSGTVCPDKTESCPAENTCCMLASGRYGCCPLPGATCCPDQKTCCPKNYVCVGNLCERKPFLHLHLPLYVEKRLYQ